MSERITFDLDGTLRGEQGESLRTGAAELLERLHGAGKELILWTTGTRESMDRFFTRFPHLRPLFSRTLSYEDGERLAEDQRNQRIRRILLTVIEGGKVPTLIGSPLVVDDAVDDMRDSARDFHFTVVDPRERSGDPSPDAWAARVAAAILGE